MLQISILSYDRMITDRWVVKDVEGIIIGLFQGSLLAVVWMDWGKPWFQMAMTQIQLLLREPTYWVVIDYLLLCDFSLSVSMSCLLKMNLIFSLVTGYKIMNYLRYNLGLCYLKYLKQQGMCACWDCVLSAVHRNIPLLWIFHLQELTVNHHTVSQGQVILVTLWHKTSTLGLEGARVQKLLKALFNSIPPYSAVTYMNRIGLHPYRS
jgi:hypothetical protein